MSGIVSSPSTEGIELLKRLSTLHSAFSSYDFFMHLESTLQVLGRRDFTLVAVDAGKASVLFSTRLREMRSRLTLPTFDREEILRLAGDPPAESLNWEDGGATVGIEDSDLPVVEMWRLGAGGSTTGYLFFHALDPEASGKSDDLVKEFHRNASVAFFKLMDRERSQGQVDLFQAKLEAINEVGEMIGSFDVDVLLTKLMELALYIVSGQVGSILLKNKDTGDVEVGVEWGLPLEMASSFCTRDGRVVYEKVMEDGTPARILDFERSAEYRVFGFDLKVDSYLCIPLVGKQRILGCVNLVNSIQEGAGFTELDREILMTISGLAATSIENALLHADSLEKERYRQSLSIARDIQRSFYPSSAPDIPGLDIAWRTESCDETGGDYFDFIPHEGGRLTVAVGDVSGHGIGAALLMASARAALRAGSAHHEGLSQVMARLNDQLEQDMEQERFMTMTMATFGVGGEEPLYFSNGGHDAPCIYRAASGEVEELEATGMPLGLFPGMSFGTGEAATLAPGDTILFTTDGVWEVNNSEGEMLGKERLKEMFEHHAGALDEAGAIVEKILADVAAYTDSAPPRDDVTLLVIRARPE